MNSILACLYFLCLSQPPSQTYKWNSLEGAYLSLTHVSGLSDGAGDRIWTCCGVTDIIQGEEGLKTHVTTVSVHGVVMDAEGEWAKLIA